MREHILRRNWHKARLLFPKWTNRKRYEWAVLRTDLDIRLGNRLAATPISWVRP
jgi:hypothetical protein